MIPAYGYSLDSEAVTFLLSCTARERRLLVGTFEQMARYPFAVGDFHLIGSDERDHQVFDVGDFVVTLWSDHAAKVVRVLLIERV